MGGRKHVDDRGMFGIILPVTTMQGRKEHRTCSQPMGVETSKSNPFANLNYWNLSKQHDLQEVDSDTWYTFFMCTVMLPQQNKAIPFLTTASCSPIHADPFFWSVQKCVHS
jgi:hypothetical protein